MSYYRNPHTHLRVPEPHFIPGYTGFCPNMPDKIGITYPWATHEVMHEQPDISMRLSAMKPPRYLYAFQVPGKDFRGDRKGGTSTTRGVCGCSTYTPKITHQHEVHVDCTGDKSDRSTGDQGSVPEMVDDFFITQKKIFCKIIDGVKKGKDRGQQDHNHGPSCPPTVSCKKVPCE